MSINKLELDEKCIYEIEKQNLDKVKQFLSSGININSILRSKNVFWVNIIFLNNKKLFFISHIQIGYKLLFNFSYCILLWLK